MGAVLGLSLTTTEVTWALVDEADRTVVDHDSLRLDAGIEIARVAARGGHGLARACGLDVERLRLVWTPDAEAQGRRLRTDLCSLGVTVDAVPMACATRVLIDPEDSEMPPLVALAYGAALADVDPAEAITVALPRQTVPRRRRPVRVLAATMGVAAAAAVGAVFLSAGSASQVEPAATTAAVPAGGDPGWVSVTAPVDPGAEPLRKVVTEPSEAYVASAAPVYEAASPAPAALASPAPPEAVAAPSAPEALPAPVAESMPTAEAHLPAADQQHLPGAEPLVAPLPGPEVDAPTLPDTDMTVPANVFTALP